MRKGGATGAVVQHSIFLFFSDKPLIFAVISNFHFAEMLDPQEMWPRKVLNFSHVWGPGVFDPTTAVQPFLRTNYLIWIYHGGSRSEKQGRFMSLDPFWVKCAQFSYLLLKHTNRLNNEQTLRYMKYMLELQSKYLICILLSISTFP
jgi:hypothetical protein